MPPTTSTCKQPNCTEQHTTEDHINDLFDAYTIAHDLLIRLLPKSTEQQRFDEITRNYVTKTDVELWFRAYGYLLRSTQRPEL